MSVAHASESASAPALVLGRARVSSVTRAVSLPISPRFQCLRRANSLAVRMRERIANWIAINVPAATISTWAAALGLSRARMRNAIDPVKCHSAPITIEMICFLPEPYRGGLLDAVALWAAQIDAGEL